jgi:uncharacterized protein YfaS (alpha-2-macroglobulin family)
MGFSTERSDALWWLMISADTNAVRALLTVLDEDDWHEDVPRMLRGALGRQRAGHWNTTTANAWGVLAVEKFSAAYEKTPVSGRSTFSAGETRQSVAWPANKVPVEFEFPWADAPRTLSLAHEGAGRPWVIVQSRAALPLDAPFSSGYAIERTVTPVEQKTPGRWTRGDVARVTLTVDAQSDNGWVVVEDPIPSGASILGQGLGRDSVTLRQGERREGDVFAAYEERRFDFFRSYYSFVPKGRFTVEYTLRYNNPGTFHLPATRVEAMYAPEMLGERPNDRLEVVAAK